MQTVDLTSRLKSQKSLSGVIDNSNRTMLNVALTSESSIKIKAIEHVLNSWRVKYKLAAYSINSEKQIPQPINQTGYQMARHRIEWLLKNHPEVNDCHLVISIENFIVTSGNIPEDYACIIFYDPQHQYEYVTYQHCAPLPSGPTFYRLLEGYSIKDENDNLIGANKTFGELYHEEVPSVPANDWMAHTASRPRVNTLISGANILAKEYCKDMDMFVRVEECFRYVPDFPVPGVNYKVWDDIFLHPDLMEELTTYIANKYKSVQYQDRPKIDYVIGVESRGFLLSARLATKMKVSEILLRKKGKIAGEKVTQSYTKEYGEDTLELRSDLPPGNVLICDDILATGGSLRAAVDLARAAGHTVVDCILVQDVPPLREVADEKLRGVSVRVLIKDKPFLVAHRESSTKE